MMNTDSYNCKADSHVHSKFSDRPSEWFLRRIGAPECFVEPVDIYRRARMAGMKFVTISDHNCIAGALEIMHLPGTYISNEVTTYFPEDGCKIHCLVAGITEKQFDVIQEARANIYEFQKYIVSENIIASVAHPLYAVNDRLSIDHVEKLLLLFNRFEGINGSRDPRASDLVNAIFRNLTPQMIEKMADKHGMEPLGLTPWVKTFTAGSDDHSGHYIASAYTRTPDAHSTEEFLNHIREGRHEQGGISGTSLRMAHSFYHIGYSFYKERFLNGTNSKNSLIGELLKRLINGPDPEPTTIRDRVRAGIQQFFWNQQKKRLGEVERKIVDEITTLFALQNAKRTAELAVDASGVNPPQITMTDDQRTFETACRISQLLTYTFVEKFASYARNGSFIESLQTIASLGPVAMGIAPYLAAFKTQHKDERMLQGMANYFESAHHLKLKSDKKAWISDTFMEVSGITRSIHAVSALAKTQGKSLTVITCLEQAPKTEFPHRNFQPVGHYPLPEYHGEQLAFPPFLEVMEYIEREKFTEIIVSTPGPMGLIALAAGRLLGIKVTGVYHTDLPRLSEHLTQDANVGQLTQSYVHWFYSQMDSILVPSKYYMNELVDEGVDARKLQLMPRGVDMTRFSPEKRDATVWSKRSIPEGFKFLCVGRVSYDRNLGPALDAFVDLIKLIGPNTKVQLIIVGDGGALTELKAKYGKVPGIYFTGFLPEEDLVRAYASANVFISPSTSDVTGSEVLEAQAAGLPVIVADIGGLCEIVEPHDSGLIVNIDIPGALTDAMRRLILNPAMCSSLRERALDNARECTWSRVLESIFNRPANLTPKPAFDPNQRRSALNHTINHAAAELASNYA